MESDDGSPPKLSLLISRPTRPQEMPTPPLHAAASVPFQWEEAPGKPRNRPAEAKPKTARALDLPPRLLFSEAKVSPTTVLDGPYMGRTMSLTSSDRNASKEYWNGRFGSSRWTSFKRNREEEAVEGCFDFSNCAADGRTAKVRISRSHLWASICDGLRQVVPWRRKQDGLRK
ncbi:hypothetical protein K1719_025243 [Acacia pycnantha]|nr:hypothetical protein K1719_025243 [Acacia pycnantha]